MKRLFGILVFFSIFLLVIGFIAYAKMELILSHILTDKFKTRVSIEDISLTPMKVIDVKHITIDNPPEYTSPYALQVDLLDIQAPYKNYLQQVIYIQKIELTNVTLTVDYVKNVTNWEALMNQIDSPETTDTNSYSVIGELTFRNLKINIIGKDGKLKSQTIPKLTLKNIKTKEGELTKRLTQAILMQLIFNIQNMIRIPLKATQDLLNAPVDTTLDNLKSLNPFGS